MLDAKILVVDDEASLREVLARYLARLGYSNVKIAEDGLAALDMLRKERVDLLLTDVRMPNLDGVKLLRQLRFEDVYVPGTLLMSGFSDLSRREMYALGVQALLDKPLNLHELKEQVATSLLTREQMWLTPLDRTVRQQVQATEAFRQVSGERHGRDRDLPLLQFGHGGFTIQQEDILTPGPVSFQLELVDQQQLLTGTGIVRWYSRKDKLAGIELAYLEEPGRTWLLEQGLCEMRNGFIPGLCLETEPAIHPLMMA